MVGVEHMYIRVEKEDLNFVVKLHRHHGHRPGQPFRLPVSPNAAHPTDGTTTLYSHRHVSDCVQSILFIRICM